jgi:hypothetical protein
MLLDVAAVALLEVVTTKSKRLPVGGKAEKNTWTELPAAIEHVLPSSIVRLFTVTEPPDAPDCMHEPPTRSTLPGRDPMGSEGTTLTQLLFAPESAAAAVKVTVKFVEVPSTTVLGEATTLVTAPVGWPMV